MTPSAWKRTQELMKAERRSRSDIVCEAVERYYTMRQWHALQARGAKSAKALKIRTEDDVDRVIHSFRSAKG